MQLIAITISAQPSKKLIQATRKLAVTEVTLVTLRVPLSSSLTINCSPKSAAPVETSRIIEAMRIIQRTPPGGGCEFWVKPHSNASITPDVAIRVLNSSAALSRALSLSDRVPPHFGRGAHGERTLEGAKKGLLAL
jgi:hypothetical protein